VNPAWNRSRRSWGYRLRSVLPPLLLWASSIPAVAESGIVLDKDTGNPIPGAVVVATWHGIISVPPEARSKCYHAEVAIAGDGGHFRISSFSGNLNPFMLDRQRHITVLAPGYRESLESKPRDVRVLMERRVGDKSDQFKQLSRTGFLGCSSDQKIFLPALKLLHGEMVLLATSTEEKLVANRILYNIESVELGDAIALLRAGVREGEIRRNRIWRIEGM
jgi:hypothetical protein